MMTVSHRRSSLKQRSLGALVALCRPLAVPTQLFFHRDTGVRFVGFSGPLGLLLMIAWTFAGASVFMMLFTALYLIRLVIYQLACHDTRQNGGPRQHTHYAGEPFWGMFSTEDKENEQKLYSREAALIGALGFLIMWIDPAAGIFLIASCMARTVIKDCLEAIAQEQMLDLMDEQIEREEIEEKLAKFHPSPLPPALPPMQVEAELLDVPLPMNPRGLLTVESPESASADMDARP